MQNVLKAFEQYYRTAINTDMPQLSVYAKRLRVSGFPYCGLRHLWENMNHVEGKEEKSDSFKDYYTSVGTVAHSVFQRFMGNGGKIYGDWKCRSCSKVKKFSASNVCRCGSEMEYVEFEVKAFKHVSGHLDGIFKINNEFWLMDYKTSSTRVINGQKKFPSLPYVKNKVQIVSYCALAEKCINVRTDEKIVISGWILIYIARDNPETVLVAGERIDDVQKAKVMRTIKRYDDQYDAVTTLNSVQQVEYLIDVKPCKTEDQYLKYYRGFDPCPLEGVCFTKHLRPTVLDEYEEKTVNVGSKFNKGKS